MTTASLAGTPLLVVGAGIMGLGIAQVAAQAGHTVLLFDAREGAAAEGRAKLVKTLDTLVVKGRLAADAAEAVIARVAVITVLDAARHVALVVEAVVENLDVKRRLFGELEDVVGTDCVLASNTSSLSITALANGLRRPGRFVGMHFFNPVPVMKLVEVVSGLQTDAAVAETVFALARLWGKVPVHARSTPGFIVNRIARPYYAEALALLLERAAEPAVIDACLRGAGFRMGPCELMDLIGHDTNLAVTESVYAANFGDKRFMPSLVQRERVDGGLLGRKTGRGFYEYASDGAVVAVMAEPAEALALPSTGEGLVLHGRGVAVERWSSWLAQAGFAFGHEAASAWQGLAVGTAQLRLTDGRPAMQVAAEEGLRDLVLFDLPIAAQGGPLACAAAAGTVAAWRESSLQWLAAAGWQPRSIDDAAGLIVARTIAMLINEASDAVQQGVCSAEGADAAMKLGVNYPAGPFEWLARWDAREVVRLLDHLADHYRGERYRVSPRLRQAAWQQQIFQGDES